MFAEASKVGAAAMRRIAEKNPEALARQLYRDHPTMSPEELFRRWVAILEEDIDLRMPVYHHTWTNIYAGIERDERAAKRRERDEARTEETVKATKEARSVKAENAAETIRTIILMDQILPDGTKLRDANKGQCRAAGGWYHRIADQLKDEQIVGEILTEQQLQELL